MVDFADLRKSIPIDRVVDLLGIVVKREGAQLRGRCPLCEDAKERSLVVTPAKGLWFSFCCEQGGDGLQLAAAKLGLGLKDAAEYLIKECSAPQRLQPIDYLQVDHESLQALGLTADVCRHFGAGYKPKGILSGRLAIPLHDDTGNLLAYCGRAVKRTQEPLLAYPKDFAPTHFNVHRLQPGAVHLTDDPLKVLVAHQHDVQAVAVLSSVSKVYASLLALLEKKGITSIQLL